MHKFFPSRLLAWFLVLSVLLSCGGDEPIDPTPVTPVTPVNPPTPEKDTTAPTITVSKSTINVISGPSLTVSGNELKIGSDLVASWKDDKSTACTVSTTLTPMGGTAKTINSGDKLSEEGKLQVKVSDEAGNSSTSEITLTAIAVYGLEILQSKTLQIDQEVNLLDGITFADGLTLQKVEIEQDGTRSVIPDATKYTPEVPGSINIILTLSRTDESTIEVKVENMTVNGIEYLPVSITDIKPVDVFPQIAQIEAGDPNIYSYVEDLRVAEAYVIREMMSMYGVGNYSPEEYQQLLSRINIGLINELPDDYANYEWIWPSTDNVSISDHSRYTFQNLTSLKGEYTCIKNLSDLGEGWAKNLYYFASIHPDDIFIFSSSTSREYYTHNQYKQFIFNQSLIDLCNLPNVLIYVAWWDTGTVNWVLYKKVYNGLYESDWDGMYNSSSMANSDQNNYPDSNMRVVIWSNDKWDVDMTNSMGSTFPVGFDDGVIVSGHPILPYNLNWKLFGEDLPRNWSYVTSLVTPATASEVQLIFGLYADVKDADTLLEMIESETEADYISLNGITQAQQKYSPAIFVKKYCMTVDIPGSMALDETVSLNKEWYKGLIFNIPGAEVKINGEWIPFTAENASRIKATNPMNLEWRLNGTLLRKYGYTSGQTLQGQIITVDDQWNGLRLEKNITIQIN